MNARWQEPHDQGLPYDLGTLARKERERRRVLGWLLASGTGALVVACGGGSDGSSATGTGTTTTDTGNGGTTSGSCIADPTETNGPYPADGSNTINGMTANALLDEGIVRTDIRTSFGSASGTAPGVPVVLTATIVNSNNNCEPLAGYAVYVWHCTRDGLYSLYSSGAQDENYLRGVQVTDAAGQVRFTTIFPGCYSGRYPHIHFEVYPSLALATNYANRTLVSQMAMPADICSDVYGSAEGYSASLANFAGITIASDNVFSDNSSAQIAQQTPALSGNNAAGYAGTILISVPA